MAVECQVATLTKPTSGTDGATQDLNLNFTPKAIYVISNAGQLNDTAVGTGHYSIGFSDGTNDACVSANYLDNSATAFSATAHMANGVYCDFDVAGSTILNRASVTFATNKVTFTWDVMDTTANVNLIVTCSWRR